MMTLCPRFEEKVDAMAWLRYKLPEYALFYDTAITILRAPVLNGIPVFGESVKQRLDTFSKVPVWLGKKVYEIDINPSSLYWKVEDNVLDMLFDDEDMEIELEKYFAATSLLTILIDINYSATFVFSSIYKRQFNSAVNVLSLELERLQASLIKSAANKMASKYNLVAIRGRHITLDASFRNFLVKEKLLTNALKDPRIIKHLVVVNGSTAYAYNTRKVAKLLRKLNIKGIKRVIRLNFEKMQKIVKANDNDTVISHVFRHPIIGYIGVGTTKTADIPGIGVPADVSEKLDGDDDGDIIDLIPSVILKNKKISFAKTILDL